MVAVVCGQGRHSDKVSNFMYTARLRCAQFRKCVMEITTTGGKMEKQGVCVCVKAESRVAVREAAMPLSLLRVTVGLGPSCRSARSS